MSIFFNFLTVNHEVSAQNYKSLDSVKLTLESDGTHNQGNLETYIQSKNGFSVADDTAHDDVIASKDTAIYSLKLNVNAGPKRTLYLDFTAKGEGLELNNIDKVISFSNGIDVGATNDGRVKLIIKRGLSGEFTANFAIRAKDTAGKVVEDNILSVSLQDEDKKELSSSSSDPLTVVSTVMGDLTLDTGNALQETSYYQTTEYGTLVIRPYELRPNGYASYGISASAPWTTDLVVDNFPAGTQFYLHEDHATPLTVNDGKITLNGTGVKLVDYKLPEDSLPTSGAGLKEYKAHIEHSQFELSQLTDPGENHPESFDTTNTEIGSLRGGTLPNNNYTIHRWLYRAGGTGLWDMSLVGPRDNGKTLFEEQNTQWTSSGDSAYLQSVLRKYITSKNDFAAKITLDSKKADKTRDYQFVDQPTDLTVEGDKIGHRYDSTKSAQVFIGDTPADESLYSIYWQTPAGEVLSNTAPANATSAKVIVTKELVTAANGEALHIYLPLKGLEYTDAQRGKLCNHQTTLSTGSAETNQWAQPSNPDKEGVFVVVPKPLQVHNELTIISNDDTDNSGRYRAAMTVTGTIINPTISEGYTYTQKVHFDSAFDIQTISIPTGSNWQIKSLDENENTVVFEYTDATLNAFNENQEAITVYLPENRFNIQTIPLYDTGERIMEPRAKAETEVTWANDTDYLSGTDAQDNDKQLDDRAISNLAEGQANYTVNQDVSSVAEASATEINDPVEFSVDASFGKLSVGNTWYQKIILPYNHDKEEWNKYNETASETNRIEVDGNGQNEAFGGQAESNYHGDYTISKIQLENAPAATKVILYKDTAMQEKLAELPIDEQGNVDLSEIEDIKQIRALQVHDGPNDSSMQATGMKINIQIKPSNNQKDDFYMIWPVGAKSSETNQEIVPWPAGARVVASTIKGKVFHDANNDSQLQEDEEGYKSLTVKLLNADGSETGKTTTTDENGNYQFENIHSGNYKIQLPEVQREENSAKVTAVNNSNTNLKAVTKNRFGVDETTLQTVAYKAFRQYATSTTAEFNLAKDSSLTDINFGYFTPTHDAALDKSAATVSYNTTTGMATIMWDVAVKNTGNLPLTDVVLNDRTSTKVNIVASRFSYAEPQPNERTVTGNIESGKVYGFENPSTNGVLIQSDEGTWASNASVSYRIKELDGVEIVGSIGKGPFYVNKEVVGGLAVWDAKGDVYILSYPNNQLIVKKYELGSAVKSTEGLYPAQDGMVILTENNMVYKIDSSGVLSQYFPSDYGNATPNIVIGNNTSKILGTTDGAYLIDIKNNTIKKVPTVSGNIVCGSGNGKAYLAYGFVLANDSEAGLGNQLWVYNDDSTNTVYTVGKANSNLPDTIGKIQKTYGYHPNLDSKSRTTGFFVQTDKGIGLVKSNQLHAFYSYEQIGKPKMVQSFGGQSLIYENEKGEVWVFDDTPHDFNITDKLGLAPDEIITNLVGDGGDYTNDGLKQYRLFGIFTNKAVYRIKVDDNGNVNKTKIFDQANLSTGDGRFVDDLYAYNSQDMFFAQTPTTAAGNTTIKSTQVYDESYRKHDTQTLKENSAEQIEGDFTRRGYNLPTIDVGKIGVLTLIGTVPIPEAEDLIVGNQAWMTSPMTPRAGITTSSVTGSNQTAGIPDLPTLPTAATFKPEAIYNTLTVSPNITANFVENKSNDSQPIPNDLADQTPAKISHQTNPHNPDDNPSKVSLSGYAWYDNDDDKKRNLSSPEVENRDQAVEGIKVTLMDENYELVNTTKTNGNGYWKFTDLKPGAKYYVQYENNWQYNGKVYQPIERLNLNSPAERTDDSDVDATSLSDLVTIPTDAQDVEYSGIADMGLKISPNSIQIIKGAKKDKESDKEELIFTTTQSLPTTAPAVNAQASLLGSPDRTNGNEMDDNDHQLFTKAYQFVISNNGNLPLTNLKLTDSVTVGLPSVFNTHFKWTHASTDDQDSFTTDNVVVKATILYDTTTNLPLILKPGDSITGYFQFAFDQSNAVHSDEMKIIGENTINHEQVTDTDLFKVSYQQQESTKVDFKKVDGYKNTALANARFAIYGTDVMTMETTDFANVHKGATRLALLTSDSAGNFSTNLVDGVYWLEENITPTGYIKPPSHWLLEVKHNDDNAEVKVYADSTMPFAGKIGDDSFITIHNYPFINVPDTGGYRLWWAVAGVGLVMISGSYIIYRKKKAIR